ncbi:MAG TPA: hypothetical protein VK550_15315 [Polyangiaceae bacterium]|nr:hypothetical protein [Polyangiaceae bacterium]
MALAAFFLVTLGGSANAAAIESTPCGSSSAVWNAPDGALVLSRSQGPVGGTLSGVGEYRTHSMLAHGNGWVTHATMYSPETTNWPTYCSTPLNPDELRNGYPGASIVSPGAIYAFLYGGGSSVEHIGYQRSCNSAQCPSDDGSDIAKWLWDSAASEWTVSRQDSSQGLYRLLVGTPPRPTNYSLFQYRFIEGVNFGGVAWNNGAVCSTFLAYAQYMADKRTVEAYTYPHDAVVNAMNGLMGAVESECHEGIGFWKNLAVNVTCFESICDDAARQVANCMAVGRCDSDDDGANTFASVRDDPASTATSISPDRLGGWSGHPWEGYLEGSGVSVWAADTEQSVQWNSAGNVYGCWY